MKSGFFLSPCPPLQLLTLCHMCEFNACFRSLKRSFGSLSEAAFLLIIPNNLTLLENLATFLITPKSKWFRNKLKSNDPNKNPRGGWRSIQLYPLQVLSIYSYSLHWALNLTDPLNDLDFCLIIVRLILMFLMLGFYLIIVRLIVMAGYSEIVFWWLH